MQRNEVNSTPLIQDIQQFFKPPSSSEYKEILSSTDFSRISWNVSSQEKIILDRFPDTEGVACSFVRLTPEDSQLTRFVVQGGHQLILCPSGGWLLKASDKNKPSYWIPQNPVLRTFDKNKRILSETDAATVSFAASGETLSIDLSIPAGKCLDLTIWCFTNSENNFLEQLQNLYTLESQPVFFWTSQTIYQSPADVFLYLIYGHIYTNRFIFPRKWKICSELDAYGLYVTLSGLELACHKPLYNLLKRQILYSVITRQAENGGWYHGEWTSLMESHYRFHNGAVMLLEAALEESPENSIIRDSLDKASSFIAAQTDKTDVGLWFLHDSCENSIKEMNILDKETDAPWIPSETFGKSVTNKLILNSHMDCTIVLRRYQDISANTQYAEIIDSAHSATCTVLKLHPADQLYHFIYKAIGLTLLPLAQAQSLPLPIRAFKRIVNDYLTPQLHRIKRKYPRFVMPGGLIDRHIAPLHYNIQYHSVNTMDLARFIHTFSDDSDPALKSILHNAIAFVIDNNTLQFWSEKKPRRYALVVWIDAMYRVCIHDQQEKYLNHLSEAVIFVEDMGMGLPPAVLGSECEINRRSQHIACPSPTSKNLRVINLSHNKQQRILVVNSSTENQRIKWQENDELNLSWVSNNGQKAFKNKLPEVFVPARGWIYGTVAL